MMLRSIKEIKGYRIFSDFTWPDDLHRFEKFNLIYGLNGSGKTTLTTIFSNLAHCCPSSAKSLLFDFDSGLDLPRCSGYLEKKSEFLHGKVLVDLPECSLCDQSYGRPIYCGNLQLKYEYGGTTTASFSASPRKLSLSVLSLDHIAGLEIPRVNRRLRREGRDLNIVGSHNESFSIDVWYRY